MQNAEYAEPAGQPLAPINTEVPASSGLGTAGTASSVPASMTPKDAKSLHKTLEKEEKHEDSTIKKQVKEISHAEKAERKAEKSDHSALKAQTKAEEKMHHANKELERAQAKHDQAIREAEKARKEVEIKKERHGQVTGHLQEAKAQLDTLTHNREAHHAERETKLHQLEQIMEKK